MPMIGGRDKRNRQPENRMPRLSALQGNTAPVILKDLLSYGQTQACAVFFTMADKGLEKLMPDCLRNSRSVVDDDNLGRPIDHAHDDFNPAGICRNSLAGISQKVVENSLKLFRIEPPVRAPAHR